MLARSRYDLRLNKKNTQTWLKYYKLNLSGSPLIPLFNINKYISKLMYRYFLQNPNIERNSGILNQQ